MNNNLILAPILIPMATAILLMFLQKQVSLQRILARCSSILMVGVAIYMFTKVRGGDILVFCASGWQPPFGITLVLDLFSSIMVLLSCTVSFACLWFSFKVIDRTREENYYYPVWFLLMMGINGSFITGDIFNLFVFFEIMLMSSYVLIVLGNTQGQLRESFKYLILNIISSAFFLIALAVLYGLMGTLNMADIASKVSQVDNQGLITLCGMIFLVVFGFKGALFPIYFWLPKSYVEPPAPVSALFGGLLTKVGVYAMIRVFTLIFVHQPEYTHTIILWLGAGTMFFGVLGAVSQMNFKQILSFHIISQVGYMIMGLGIFTVWSIAGAIYYIAHHIIVKSCLFLLEGATEKITGTGDLKKMGGLLTNYPVLGWTFFIAGISLAGVPPLSGFFSKFVLMQSAVMVDNYWILAVAIVVGFLTLFSMMKIFIYAFWGETKPVLAQDPKFNYISLLPSCFLLVGLSIAMGLGAQPMIDLAMTTANQLMTPDIYINAVLSTPGIK